MTWQTFAFLVVASAAFGYSGYRFSILYRMLRAQKGPARNRLTDLPARLIDTAIHVLGQKAVLRKKGIGLIHTTIFWGFIIITVGTLEQFATTLHQGWNFEFLGPLYSPLLSIQDFFTVAILFAVGGAFYRRLVIRPEGLGQSRDANIVLIFTGSLMVSILVMNAFQILGVASAHADAFIFSKHLAEWAYGLGLSFEGNASMATLFKWVHMLLVLGFAAYIPHSKHLHIIAAGPNTFLRQLTREKGMRPINFADESITQYGAAKITDLSWKDTLDTYACTECGRCQDLCPAWNTQKPLSPKLLVLDIKHNLYDNKDALLAGKTEELTPLVGKDITEDVIWACTSCRACEVACPVFIEQTDKIFDIRRNLVMMESRMPDGVQAIFKNLETNATPWAFSSADRGKWAEDLSVPSMADGPEIDVLLWVGCAGSYDDRNKKVLRSFVSLLKKAGVRFAILGNEEQCTGDPARRIGNEYLYQTLAQANIETLNRYAVKKIVTACPHCFNTLKNEYKDFGGTYEVFHHSQFIAGLIREGRLKPTKGVDESITFHDSCYLGRWNNIYDQPRAVLGSIPSARLVEMRQNKDEGLCCGAGGGRMFMEETIGKRINIARTEQALETHAGIVAASCPFCMTMMTDGVKSKEMLDKVKVLDIAELMDQAT
jgi:Fe-S oxidoreductase